MSEGSNSQPAALLAEPDSPVSQAQQILRAPETPVAPQAPVSQVSQTQPAPQAQQAPSAPPAPEAQPAPNLSHAHTAPNLGHARTALKLKDRYVMAMVVVVGLVGLLEILLIIFGQNLPQMHVLFVSIIVYGLAGFGILRLYLNPACKREAAAAFVLNAWTLLVTLLVNFGAFRWLRQALTPRGSYGSVAGGGLQVSGNTVNTLTASDGNLLILMFFWLGALFCALTLLWLIKEKNVVGHASKQVCAWSLMVLTLLAELFAAFGWSGDVPSRILSIMGVLAATAAVIALVSLFMSQQPRYAPRLYLFDAQRLAVGLLYGLATNKRQELHTPAEVSRLCANFVHNLPNLRLLVAQGPQGSVLVEQVSATELEAALHLVAAQLGLASMPAPNGLALRINNFDRYAVAMQLSGQARHFTVYTYHMLMMA